ncbi:hypothetical protein QQ045_013451 [Rhodiola kirilowii]
MVGGVAVFWRGWDPACQRDGGAGWEPSGGVHIYFLCLACLQLDSALAELCYASPWSLRVRFWVVFVFNGCSLQFAGHRICRLCSPWVEVLVPCTSSVDSLQEKESLTGCSC